MKKSFILLSIILLLLIIGAVLTIYGCIEGEDYICNSICSSIGTGLIASSISSLMIEIINIIALKNKLKRLEKIFFKPYIHSFYTLRDVLPSINDLQCYDNISRNFCEYVSILLDDKANDGQVCEDIIFEFEYYVEKIKNSVEFLLSQEFEVAELNNIYSKLSELKKQRETCNRILGNLRNKKYSAAVANIIKLKNSHLTLFPNLAKDFDNPYLDNDQ